MGISHWNHIVLTAQDNSEMEHFSFYPATLKVVLWPGEEAPKCFIWCWHRICVCTFWGMRMQLISFWGMKYSFAAFMDKAAQCLVVDELAAQCELEALLYGAAFWVGIRCLPEDADEFSMGKEGKDSLAVLVLLCASRVLQPTMRARCEESGLPRNISLYLEHSCVFSFFQFMR